MKLLRCSLLCCLVLLVRQTLHAQKREIWPDTRLHLNHHIVSVLTVSQPGLRQGCIPKAIDTVSLTCEEPGSGARVVYPRDEVAAIFEIAPPSPFHYIGVGLAVAGGGVLLAAIIIDPIAGLLGGGIVLCAIEVAQVGPFAPRRTKAPKHERVLYQRVGTPLSAMPY